MKLSLKTILVTFAASILLVPFFARAAQSGIQISPVTYNFEINPNESKEFTITLTNLNSADLNYVIEIEDFSQVSDEGAPSFAGTASSADASVTTLKDWISPKKNSDKEGVISPKQIKDIVFIATIPKGAEAGGHYAAVFAKEVKKNAEGQTELGVASRVGTLILVSVPGVVSKTAEISEFKAPKLVWHGPIDFGMKVKNTGTVHFDSEAKVDAKSWLGKHYVIDLGKHTIIPNNERKYSGTWQSRYPFGRYTLTASATDGNGQPVTTTAILWAIPLVIVIPILVGIIILIWIIIYLRRHVRIV